MRQLVDAAALEELDVVTVGNWKLHLLPPRNAPRIPTDSPLMSECLLYLGRVVRDAPCIGDCTQIGFSMRFRWPADRATRCC